MQALTLLQIQVPDLKEKRNFQLAAVPALQKLIQGISLTWQSLQPKNAFFNSPPDRYRATGDDENEQQTRREITLEFADVMHQCSVTPVIFMG